MKPGEKVVVRAVYTPQVMRAKIVSVNYSKRAKHLARAEPGEASPHSVIPLPDDEEGLTWAKGWDTPEANALRSAVMLAP